MLIEVLCIELFLIEMLLIKLLLIEMLLIAMLLFEMLLIEALLIEMLLIPSNERRPEGGDRGTWSIDFYFIVAVLPFIVCNISHIFSIETEQVWG